MKRKSLVDILLASGLEDRAEAQTLAGVRTPGTSWTVDVLNSGKVDEVRFTEQLGEFFGTPVETMNITRLDRTVLTTLPSRFVFKHHILPLVVTEESVRLATYDGFNTVARRLASQLTNGKKIEWVLVPRTQLLRAIKTLYGVGAETFEELLQNTRTYEADNQDGAATDLNAD
ncbi:MAG: type II/IV secretion system protein, partial [Verrucomicrobiota bacterium]